MRQQDWAKFAGLGILTLVVVLAGTLMVRSVGQPSGQTPGPNPHLVSSAQTPGSAPVYAVQDLPTSRVHTLTIPAAATELVVPELAEQTQTLETFSERSGALAILNGGFFDPQNQQSTSYVMQQGVWVGDPRQNARLMQNPALTPYLDKILNRSELRRYRCEGSEQSQYAIARHQEALPATCELIDALGAGPQLLPDLTLEAEGFTATDADGKIIRDALGSSQPNARTAIGILPDGGLIWVMAAQKPGLAASGLTLPELAAFLKDQGAVAALNLDGGSSSGLLYNGEAIYGKLDSSSQPVIRPVKSVLLLKRS